MSARPRLFIGSSTEGLRLAKVLKQLLAPAVTVELWPSAFRVGETYIGVLEQESKDADFAVLLLTDDDEVISRKTHRHAPRDNVLFEAGLFIGGLGADRCYVVQDTNVDLKLPTDLLNVVTARYSLNRKRSLRSALQPACDMILKQIKRKRTRIKVSASQLAQLVAARQFSQSIKGFWWCDREWDKENSVAFVEVSDEGANWMPKVKGQAWDRRGESVASWSSVATCVQPVDGVLYFNFTGHHPPSRNARDLTSGEYVGFTTYTFHPPLGSPVTGEGEISDFNLDHKKVRKLLHLRLRRCTSSKEIEVMTEEKPNRRKIARVVVQQLPVRPRRRAEPRA